MSDVAAPSARAPEPARAPGGRTDPALLAIALGIWGFLAFGHGLGLRLAYGFFEWARQPGNLHAEGGREGMAVAELFLTLSFAAAGVGAFAVFAWQLRGTPLDRRRVLEAAIPWALWAVLVTLVWQCFIVYATEMVHFVQYAVIGFLIALALGRGRRPQLAFLITFGLGFVDEVWQHYGLHRWWMDDQGHFMDWSDTVLDGLGACAGILPFVTLARLRGVTLEPSFHLVRGTVAVCALLFLPLLLLSGEMTSKVLGHYIHYPFWGEYDNLKPTHWPNPREGIPLNLAALLVIGTILEPRRRGVSQAGLLVLASLLALAINPYSRAGGMPVHEDVPVVRAPWTGEPIVIDGVLDEAAWERAPRLGPFVNAQDGRSVLRRDDGSSEPLKETYARVLWDERAIYFAFEVSDDDIWARDTHRDDRALPGDEVVEIFLDVGGDEVTYYEFEFSPLNVVYDLFNFIPSAPVDFTPWQPFIGLPNWDARGLESAVRVDGAVDVVEGFAAAPTRAAPDRGWTVEVAIPWEDFRTTTTPSSTTMPRSALPPADGARWRLNLYRVERPRADPSDFGAPGETVSEDEARELLRCTARGLARLVQEGKLAPADPAAAERRFGRAAVVRLAAQERAQLQAWAPVHHPSFHRPARFGVIEFVGRPGAD